MEKICIKLLHLLDLSISLSVSITIQQIYAFAHTCRQRKCNANLELQIYHIFAPFANISKSVFSSSEGKQDEIPKKQCREKRLEVHQLLWNLELVETADI